MRRDWQPGDTRRLALDHLTVARASPSGVVELAAQCGCGAACILLGGLAHYPETGGIDLVGDARARRQAALAAQQAGISIDWAYPIILSARCGARDLQPRLEAAASVGAGGVVVLVYDRDPARRMSELASLCGAAALLGLRVAVEFFASSALPDLASSHALIQGSGVANAGHCVDLLHLRRSGGNEDDVMAAADHIVFAQICDGLRAAPADLALEALQGRLLPGHGDLDAASFVKALPSHVRLGIEVPRHCLAASVEEAAHAAVSAAAHVLQQAAMMGPQSFSGKRSLSGWCE